MQKIRLLEHSAKMCDLLAYQAGELLAKIHSIKYKLFGKLSDESPFLKTKSWKKYLKFLLD